MKISLNSLQIHLDGMNCIETPLISRSEADGSLCKFTIFISQQYVDSIAREIIFILL